MSQTIDFVKASGAGNDFVLINNMQGEIAGDHAALAVAVCSRHLGIGADGLILLQKSAHADFTMAYYNADGSFGGMCGNGGRCVARFAYLLGISSSDVRFEALDHVYQAQVVGDKVRLTMKDPVELRTNLMLPLGGQHFSGHAIDTGAPHLVLFVDDIENVNVTGVGAGLRHHVHFQPKGVNVNFVRHVAPGSIEIRTYERGVEAETLACGTGSVASAVISSVMKGSPSPVTVRVRSGEELKVSFRSIDGKFSSIVLEGSARMLFRGSFLYDFLSHQLLDAPHVMAFSQSLPTE